MNIKLYLLLLVIFNSSCMQEIETEQVEVEQELQSLESLDEEPKKLIDPPTIALDLPKAGACKGSIPLNAKLCTVQQIELERDFSRTLVSSCKNTPCTYKCLSGYNLSANKKKCDPVVSKNNAPFVDYISNISVKFGDKVRVDANDRKDDKDIDGHKLTYKCEVEADNIGRLYYSALSRFPGPKAYKFWSEKLSSGKSIEEIGKNFINSKEFKSKYGHLNNRAFITQMYLNILKRQPDAKGLKHWEGLLNKGFKREKLLVSFSKSKELVSKKMQMPCWSIGAKFNKYTGVLEWDAISSGRSIFTISASDNQKPKLTGQRRFFVNVDKKPQTNSLPKVEESEITLSPLTNFVNQKLGNTINFDANGNNDQHSFREKNQYKCQFDRVKDGQVHSAASECSTLGIHFERETGKFNWIINETGTFEFKITMSNSNQSVSQNFEVAIDQVYSCLGSIPNHGVACYDETNGNKPSQNLTYSYVGTSGCSNTEVNECKFECDSGYEYYSPTNSCSLINNSNFSIDQLPEFSGVQSLTALQANNANINANVNGKDKYNGTWINFSCVYDTVIDGVVSAGQVCPNFITKSGFMSLVSFLTQDRLANSLKFEFKITAKHGSNEDSQIVSLEVLNDYVAPSLKCSGQIAENSMACFQGDSFERAIGTYSLAQACTPESITSNICLRRCINGYTLVEGKCLPSDNKPKSVNSPTAKEKNICLASSMYGLPVEYNPEKSDYLGEGVVACYQGSGAPTQSTQARLQGCNDESRQQNLCRFTCKEGYYYDGSHGKCYVDIRNYKYCQGADIRNAVSCGDNDPKTLASVVKKLPVVSCTSQRSCEWKCKPGYKPDGNRCVEIILPKKCDADQSQLGEGCIANNNSTQRQHEPKDFVFKIETTRENQIVTLPIAEEIGEGYKYDFNISWGDGSGDYLKDSDSDIYSKIHHQYETPGVYKIIISGTFEAMENEYYRTRNYDGHLRVVEVVQLGDVGWKSLKGAFSCGIGVSDNGRQPLKFSVGNSSDTSQVTDMSYMFKGCKFDTAFNLSELDMSNVKVADEMFTVSAPEINFSNVNIESVESMQRMFLQANIGKVVLSADAKKLKDLTSMFQFAVIDDLDMTNFNTPSLETINSMFKSADIRSRLNLSQLNTSKVTDMANLLSGTKLHKGVFIGDSTLSDFGTKFYTGNVKDFDGAFGTYKHYTKELDLSALNTEKALIMRNMIKGTGLNKVVVNSFDTKNVEDFSGMFRSLESIKNLDLSHFNTDRALDMSYMFKDMRNLKKLNIKGWNISRPELKKLFIISNTQLRTDYSKFICELPEGSYIDYKGYIQNDGRYTACTKD